MTNDENAELWLSQEGVKTTFDEDDVRASITRFSARADRFDLLTALAAGLLIALCTYMVFAFSRWETRRVGGLLGLPACLFILVHLYRNHRARLLLRFEQQGIAFFREALVRRREMYRSYWGWYIAPLLPMVTVFLIGPSLEWHRIFGGQLAMMALVLVGLAGEYLLMRKRVRQIDAELSALEV
jgi:hypothetical protein